MIARAITSRTATMKPNTVVTIQYFRTLVAKLARPSAMCGRVSRITPSRSGMLAASKARKMTTVTISSSRETPPLMPLSSA